MQHSRKRSKRYSRRRINFRRLAAFMLFLAIGIVGLVQIVDYGVDSVRRKRENAHIAREYAEAFTAPEAAPQATAQPLPTAAAAEIEIPKQFRTLQGEIPQKARSLYQQNDDLVGWLYIGGIVNLPVVYRDNEYYLNHNFNRKEDDGGALFLDEYHPLTEETQNLVIHGHNMYDSTMFGILSNYEKLGIVKSHPFARFSTMYAPEDYVVFAVLRVNPNMYSGNYFEYIGSPKFGSADEFQEYVGEIRQRSKFEIPVDVQPGDALLTLATCIDDDRLVVVFRRIRDGESREALQAQVDLARRR